MGLVAYKRADGLLHIAADVGLTTETMGNYCGEMVAFAVDGIRFHLQVMRLAAKTLFALCERDASSHQPK